jgi:Cys-tRNA(Pro) deacylase
MSAPDIPVTAAVRSLRAAGIPFEPLFYAYVERGGTGQAAASLGLDEHAVVKTLVMEAHEAGGRRNPFIVLMHGDREVSTKGLARFLGVRTVAPAGEADVTRFTGYVPGGVSPFGTRKTLPVYAEETILSLGRIYINGGKRGFLVAVRPSDLERVLAVKPVNVGLSGAGG